MSTERSLKPPWVFIFSIVSGSLGAFFGIFFVKPIQRETLDQCHADAKKLDDKLEKDLEASELEVARLRGRVMAENEERFEERNGLQSSFDNCSEKDGVARCSARTDTGTPVSYHCTIDKCEIDGSPR